MDHNVKLTTPSRPLLITQKSVTRSSSVRSKGINFNTVSPTPGATGSHNDPIKGRNEKASKAPAREKGSPGPAELSLIDRPLPLAQELRSLNLDDQLRLLALKEMAVVAINDSINTLKQKLDSTQGELHQLRSIIQKSLSRQVHSQKIVQHRRSNSHSLSKGPKNGPKMEASNAANTSIPPDGSLTLWSNLSKPISFLQQLDSIIQNEMEKSLAPPTQPHREPKLLNLSHKTQTKSRVPVLDQDSTESEEALPVNLDRYLPQHEPKYRNTDDMFQAVSSSLWSFVSEVKTNMMATLSEPQAENQTLHDKGHTEDDEDSLLSLADITEPNLSTEESEDERDHLDLSIYSSMRKSNKK